MADAVDAVVGARRDDAAASVRSCAELMLANRIVAPCSKLASVEWWATTAGDRMVKLPQSALDHRRFWDAMDQLTPAMLQEIHKRVVTTMVAEYAIEPRAGSST